MNRPPATARPQKATSRASPAGDASTAAGPIGSGPGEITEAMEAMARANRPISRAPIGTSARFGRPWLARAASTEPTAMPTVNTARQSVTTPSLPPMTPLTRVGSSVRATKPTTQNQETMRAPPHSFLSPLTSPSSAMVEVHGLRVMARSGAAGPAAGIARANSQDATASARISRTMTSALWACATATPPAIVPARMARKVAPSTRALPAGSSAVASFSGRMPYFTGPNRAAMTPNRPSATNRIGTEWK